MKRDISYVSEQWLRTYVYEHGKDGEDDAAVGSDPYLHLAEARATLLEWRGHRRADSSESEADLLAGVENSHDV